MNEIKKMSLEQARQRRGLLRKEKQGLALRGKEKKFGLEGHEEIDVEIKIVQLLSLQPDPESLEIHARRQTGREDQGNFDTPIERRRRALLYKQSVPKVERMEYF